MPQLLPWLLPLLQEYILTLSIIVLKENRHPRLQARLRASSTEVWERVLIIGLGTSQSVCEYLILYRTYAQTKLLSSL